nr:hypothetical protein HK105_002894 [Polyrhizophydium stewartii]
MLGFPPVLKHVVPATSIRWLLPTFQLQFLDGASKRQRATADTAGQRGLPWFLASPTGDTLAGPPPALVISTCSETTLAALAVRRAGQSAGTKAIHVMGPAVDVTHFDACVLPRYIWPTFGKTGPKEVVRRIFRTDLHVNLITPERLQAASAEPVPAAFRDLQADRTVAVLVSGMPSG